MNNPADFSAEIWLPPVCQYSLTLFLSLIYIFFKNLSHFSFDYLFFNQWDSLNARGLRVKLY